ncbi:hypothetical protein K438DRAFT_1941811 [Mycena galopus ATCC 62051]|nr:hypothetical protein K438DRAFT_1941811 [Mycena galopus ATCC 62051]
MDPLVLTPESFYSTPLRRRHSSAIPPLPPITPGASPIPAPSSQQRERAPQRDKWQKADVILQLITKDFRSLGAFLETLFHCRDLSINDPRTASHKRMVTVFLRGESNIGMGAILELIYRHPQGRPENANPESNLYFSPPSLAPPLGVKFARPAVSTWALQLVGTEMCKQIGTLTQNDPDNPNDTTQLRASTNGRAKNIRLATWDDLGRVFGTSPSAWAHPRLTRQLWCAQDGHTLRLACMAYSDIQFVLVWDNINISHMDSTHQAQGDTENGEEPPELVAEERAQSAERTCDGTSTILGRKMCSNM